MQILCFLRSTISLGYNCGMHQHLRVICTKIQCSVTATVTALNHDKLFGGTCQHTASLYLVSASCGQSSGFGLHLMYVLTEPGAQFWGVACGVYVPAQHYFGVGIIISCPRNKKTTREWSWPLTSILCCWQLCMMIYFHPLIMLSLHDAWTWLNCFILNTLVFEIYCILCYLFSFSGLSLNVVDLSTFWST
jgi:hypothetical protein